MCAWDAPNLAHNMGGLGLVVGGTPQGLCATHILSQQNGSAATMWVLVLAVRLRVEGMPGLVWAKAGGRTDELMRTHTCTHT